MLLIKVFGHPQGPLNKDASSQGSSLERSGVPQSARFRHFWGKGFREQPYAHAYDSRNGIQGWLCNYLLVSMGTCLSTAGTLSELHLHCDVHLLECGPLLVCMRPAFFPDDASKGTCCRSGLPKSPLCWGGI